MVSNIGGFMNLGSSILVFSTVLFSTFAQAKNLSPEKNTGKISFVAVGKPSMLKISGEDGNLNVTLSESNQMINGNVSIDLKDLSTGIDLRDRHLKEKYLEITKFPKAQLELKNLKLLTPTAEIKSPLKNLPFQGTLTLHGVTKNVSGQYDLESQEKSILVHASFVLKISDYDIKVPAYMGISVADNVTVETVLTLKK
jgi:polyisoprenoid-binding protein YceI